MGGGGGQVEEMRSGAAKNLTQKHKGTKKRDFDRINRIKDLLTSASGGGVCE